MSFSNRFPLEAYQDAFAQVHGHAGKILFVP
jgi:hypothetical protein